MNILDDIKIDINALMQEIEDQAIMSIVSIMIDDKDERKLIRNLFMIFKSHGIRVNESMKIITEIIDCIKDYTEESNEE